MTDPTAPLDKFGRPWVRVITNNDGGQSILWTCPTCYRGLSGRVADEPVSGWDAPRWKVTGDPEGVFSLTPSLGCAGMKDGSCTGHWWYRDGRLVAA